MATPLCCSSDCQLARDRWKADEWAAQTSRFRCRSTYQTFEYGQAHAGLFRSIERLGVYYQGQLTAACQLHVKQLPLVGAGIVDGFNGPMWDPQAGGPDAERGLRMLLGAIRTEYAQKRNLEVRLRPPSTLDEGLDQRLARIMAEEGFTRHEGTGPQGGGVYQTVLLDLSLSLEQLRKNLHQSWRRHLSQAERAGLELVSGRQIELFDRFVVLYEQMWAHKRFICGAKIPRIRRMHHLLPPGERFYINLVRHEGKDIAGSVCASFGDTFHYFLGASASDARKVNPGYLLQWTHIVQGRELGRRWYDTGGIPDDAPEIVNFKMRMNGRAVQYPGHFVAPPVRGPSAVFRVAEGMLYRLRQLRSVKVGLPAAVPATPPSKDEPVSIRLGSTPASGGAEQ